MDFTWYSNIGGIVAATIMLVEILKRWAGSAPVISRVPTWLYAVLISGILTEVAHAVLGTLPGEDLQLLMQAIMSAAVASGFKEWISNAGKPLSASTAARDARMDRVVDISRLIPIVLLTAALLGGAATLPGCSQGIPIVTVPAVSLQNLATLAMRVRQAGDITKQAQQVEIGLYQLSPTWAPTHAAIQQGFLSLSVSVQAGIDIAASTVTPQSARQLLTTIDQALTTLERDIQGIPHATVRGVLSSMTQTIRILLQLQLQPGDPVAALQERHSLVLENGGSL